MFHNPFAWLRCQMRANSDFITVYFRLFMPLCSNASRYRNASLFGDAGVVNKLNESHLYAHKSRFKRWPFHKFHTQRSTISEKRTGLSGQPCRDRAINCPFSVWKVIGIRVLRLYSPISLPFRTCLMRHGSKNSATTSFALYRPIKMCGSLQTRNCSTILFLGAKNSSNFCANQFGIQVVSKCKTCFCAVFCFERTFRNIRWLLQFPLCPMDDSSVFIEPLK